MPNLPNTFGVFLVLEILAAPFGYEGAAALMNRQWVRGAIAYLIALPLGAAGLMTLGVPILGHDLTQAIRIFLTEWPNIESHLGRISTDACSDVAGQPPFLQLPVILRATSESER
jgi:hypothetical protein